MRITRRLEFDAGHRVLGHEGKCKHLHGHRYVAEISCSAKELDPLSRVIDFGVVKEFVGQWIEDNWDHNILLNALDPLVDFQSNHAVWQGKLPFILPPGLNPTAEVMARILLEEATALLKGQGIMVTHVRLYETPNCWADYYFTDSSQLSPNYYLADKEDDSEPSTEE